MSLQFSVITSVYKNDKPEYIRVALDSLLVQQTVKPDEIVLVQDGPVSHETSRLLLEYKDNYDEKLNVIKLTQNKGLGNALMLGVENAKYDIVARMDSDDICAPDRFEKQLAYLESHPECDIVGGQITEFIDTPDNIVGKREVPCDNEAIYHYMRSRCALNHPTVMFKKKAVLDAGNYQDWFWNEDYYMWIRMMEQGCVFANLPDVLVNMRSGLDQYGRRGGKKYFDSEIGIKKLMLEKGMITRKEYFINYIQRFIIQLMLPNSVRGWVFRTFARKVA
jgi:glycosyltransferase involved in cell wall biosynthesis